MHDPYEREDRAPTEPAEPRSVQRMVGRRLTWSAQEPKRRGWWWFKAATQCKPFLVEVREADAGMLQAFMPWGRTYLYRTTSSEAWWAGPLDEPEHAPDVATPPNDPSSATREGEQ